jgi:uncharacterized cupredoxin-like copper-binding protein
MNKTWYTAGSFLSALTAFISGETMLLPAAANAATKAGPNVVNVVAKENSYEMPDTLPAGPTLFHFTDDGKQLHHMTILKLEDGKTLADFKALPPGPFPTWAVFEGGPNTSSPQGGQDEDIVDLSPGNYVVLCLIPGPDGKPHMMDGMMKSLKVTPSTQARTMPAADLTLTLTSYAFTFSAPVTAGKHTVRIINKGDQPHEAVLFRLAPGKVGKDIANWLDAGMQGPPPAKPVTGISAEAPGKDNTLLLDLAAGKYALLCFVPDAKDGRTHADHGMIYNFDVI